MLNENKKHATLRTQYNLIKLIVNYNSSIAFKLTRHIFSYFKSVWLEKKIKILKYMSEGINPKINKIFIH